MNNSNNQVYLAGIGTYLGSDVVEVDNLIRDLNLRHPTDDHVLNEKEMARVKRRVGTNRLSRFSANESLEECSAIAIKKAILNSGYCLGDINGLYFATASSTAKYSMPTPEVVIGNKLGLENLFAVPVGSGCTGALMALKAAYNQLRVDGFEGKESVYVIASSDKTTDVLAQDRASLLFGEGAGAIVLTNRVVRNGYSIDKIFLESLISGNELGVLSMNIPNQERVYSMDGDAVTNFVLYKALPIIRSGLGLDNVKEDFYVVPHQASDKIIKLISQAWDMDKSRVYTEDLGEIGNLTVSSWLVAFHNVLRKNLVRADQTVVPITFGAGLNAGGFVASPFGDPRKIVGM
jgi:3-oxoacyl-[acyl-carrier-protein] synthase III